MVRVTYRPRLMEHATTFGVPCLHPPVHGDAASRVRDWRDRHVYRHRRRRPSLPRPERRRRESRWPSHRVLRRPQPRRREPGASRRAGLRSPLRAPLGIGACGGRRPGRAPCSRPDARRPAPGSGRGTRTPPSQTSSGHDHYPAAPRHHRLSAARCGLLARRSYSHLPPSSSLASAHPRRYGHLAPACTVSLSRRRDRSLALPMPATASRSPECSTHTTHAPSWAVIRNQSIWLSANCMCPG